VCSGNVAQNSSMPTISAASTAGFEEQRVHLTAVAYRMLGSRAEAEDAVQETWLRYAGTDRDTIRDLRGWLTTTTGRICLDVLRSARVRREAYPGPWLPEPVVTRLPGTAATDPAAGFAPDPAAVAERSAEVGLALLVVMERLSPEQRVALVLHDAFAVPFEEIATILSTTPAAARQLAARGRRAVADGGARHTADLAEQRRVLTAFLAAAGTGDLTALAAVLAPGVVAIGDGGGIVSAGRNAVVGAERVARFYAGVFARRHRDTRGVTIRPVLVNGDLGVLIRGEYADGRPLLSVLTAAVADGRVTAIYNQLNPEKLTRLDDQ
jgi:RNA polymerase sigma-70 factor (ECF subfamily)